MLDESKTELDTTEATVKHEIISTNKCFMPVFEILYARYKFC